MSQKEGQEVSNEEKANAEVFDPLDQTVWVLDPTAYRLEAGALKHPQSSSVLDAFFQRRAKARQVRTSHSQ